jgi:ketosteroid isomerase-like protein
MTAGSLVVGSYLERIVAHDWEGVASCLADDVERVGPFGDTYSGRGQYIAFLSDLMPKLEDYSMRVDRVESDASGRVVFAELTETLSMGGEIIETPEVLVFDLDEHGLIGHISIYIQRLGGGGAQSA